MGIYLQMAMMRVLPRLVVFDLDFCLWHPEMYELAGSPFRKQGEAVVDKRGTEIELFPAARTVLNSLATDPQWEQTQVAYASRTDKPAWARECLGLIEVAPGVTMEQLGAYAEIGGGDGAAGCKTNHFGKIQAASGLSYNEMIFFDDGMYNCRDVNPLGVLCVCVPNGMTTEAWQQGLQTFQDCVEGGIEMPIVG